jgi:predicted permease
MRKLFRRIAYLSNRRRADRELESEMAAHRAMLDADQQSSFGNMLRLREESRDAWGWVWLDQFRQDLAYGARQLRRFPGFTLTAVAVLALGMGVNLALARILDAAVFHWLTIRDAESVLEFTPAYSSAAIDHIRDHNTVFSYVVAERSDGSVFYEDQLEPEHSVFVSGDYFADLGVNPAQGRLLDARDNGPNAPPVVVLSYGYWQRRFASDPAIVGRVIRLNAKLIEVVGVAPPDFTGLSRQPGSPPSLWLPLVTHPYLMTGSKVLNDFSQRDTSMFAMLKPGVSLPAAEGQLASLISGLRDEHPDQIGKRDELRGVAVTGIPHDALPVLSLVTLLVVMVLIAACANLGNILLARGQARAREIDIRVSLGAGVWRIVRQLMIENLLLAALGAGAAFAVGAAGARILLSAAGESTHVHSENDWRIVIATIVLALISAAAFGLAPAMQAVRRSTRATRTRKILVAVQVAASCFLLIIAGILTRSTIHSLAIDVRFDYRHMAVLDPRLNSHGLAGAAGRQALEEISASLERVPGVTGVTTAVFAPFSGRPGLPEFRPGLPRILYNQVAASYFELMDLRLVRGRLYSAGEPGAIILSQSTARAVWPGEDPLGKTLDVPAFNVSGIEGGGVVVKSFTFVGSRDSRTVVGVVQDSGSSRTRDTLQAYMPISDANFSKAVLIVRTGPDPAGLLQNTRSAASRPGLIPSIWLMRTRAEQDAGPPPGVLLGVGSLSATATSLAAVGMFGLIAFSVAQRTREIGVRIALGASPIDIVGTLVSQYSIALGAGILAGVALALGVALLMRSRFIGLETLDPLAYAGALAVFGSVAVVAVMIPARKALNIDPASALRWE